MNPHLSFPPADPIRAAACALRPDPRTFDPLLEWMGDASIVLIGAGSYGTHEFHQARIAITRRLIEERGFTAVAIDADWQLTRPVNRFVRGKGRATEAVEALSGLACFPSWRWRNADLLDFTGWLRAHNASLAPSRQTGFYGLSLFGVDSVRELALSICDRLAPACAACLRERSALPPGRSAYLPLRFPPFVKEELIARLLRHHYALSEMVMQQDSMDEDDYFFLVENARQSRNAEEYYRSLFMDETTIWHIRATHSATMVDALLGHQERHGRAKIVVWGHNVLLGDSRAVGGQPGESSPSLGQAMRERHAAETFLIGQTTHRGTIAAAAGWDRPVERRRLPEAPPGSVEALFHQTGLPRLMLNLHGDEDAVELLRDPLLERIPGVVLPKDGPIPAITVRFAERFDAVLHFDQTRAVEPLEV